MLDQTNDPEENANLVYEHLYGTIEGKIVLYVNLFLVYVIGPLLAVGIVIFEAFGGDSQKRTIVNRLLSFALGSLAIYSVITGSVRVARDIFGLLDFQLMVWIQLFAQFWKFAAILFYQQLTISRYLFIVVWKRMKIMDDQFWAFFLTSSTYLISLWAMCCTLLTGYQPNFGLLINLAKEPGENGTNVHR